MLDLPRLLTNDEAEDFLRLKRGTLPQARLHKRAGYPPHIKVGRLVRYRLDHIQAWLEQQTVTK